MGDPTNPYRVVGNDPVNGIDPSGYWLFIPDNEPAQWKFWCEKLDLGGSIKYVRYSKSYVILYPTPELLDEKKFEKFTKSLNDLEYSPQEIEKIVYAFFGGWGKDPTSALQKLEKQHGEVNFPRSDEQKIDLDEYEKEWKIAHEKLHSLFNWKQFNANGYNVILFRNSGPKSVSMLQKSSPPEEPVEAAK